MREPRNGGAELLQGVQWLTHECSSAAMGQGGLQNLESRNALEGLLLQPGTNAPRAALRTANLEAETEVAKLVQVQRLKRQLMNNTFSTKVLGDLVDGLASRKEVPASENAAWWCYEDVRFDAQDKPIVAVVASNPRLLHRWCAMAPAGADGAYKFNSLGWPLTLLGITNPAGPPSIHHFTL